MSIRERPAEAEDRAVPGHWEGDLLFGSNHSQIATLVERHSRYVMLVKVPSKDTRTVINALIRQARKLPRELYKSLTWDRGKEMADHQRFSLATDVKVYFCDPQSPWQRGSNEQINGLLRQYFPKGMDLPGKMQGVDGASAPALWAAGEYGKVLSYVAQDAKQTLDLAEAVEAAGELRWISRSGKENSVKIDKWLTVAEAMQLPEPDVSWMDNPWPRSKFVGWLS